MSTTKMYPVFATLNPPQRSNGENAPPAKLPQRTNDQCFSDEADTMDSSEGEEEYSDTQDSQLNVYQPPTQTQYQQQYSHQSQFPYQQQSQHFSTLQLQQQQQQYSGGNYGYSLQSQITQSTTLTPKPNKLSKSKKSNAPDFKSRLITLIRENRCLWDEKCEQKKNRQTCDNAWTSISHHMNLSIEECKSTWKNLRDVFKRENKVIFNFFCKYLFIFLFSDSCKWLCRW